MKWDFNGKTVMITGAAQGIGYEVAKGVVEGGGHAIILDLNLEKAQAAADQLGNASAYKIDCGDSANIREVVAQVLKDFPKVDVEINVAGIISRPPFQDVSDEEWEKVIRINLTGVFTMCSAIYPYFMKNGGGRIVNVSSVAGKIGGGLMGTSAYASSKAGVIGLTKAIAKEGGKYGISCNAVCPSLTKTPMTSALTEDMNKRIISMIPLGRAADPSEPAQMILFFASDAASFVNGEIGDCDGGIVLD